MRLTKKQESILLELGMCKVEYGSLLADEKQYGYTYRGPRAYHIRIDNSVNAELQNVILLHEVGHVYLGHMDRRIKGELVLIKELCKKHNVPFISLARYGGPISFINVCMDLHVNSDVLTKGNCEILKKNGIEGCTLESVEVEYMGEWFNYYEPLIKKIADNPNAENQNANIKNGVGQDLSDADMKEINEWLDSLSEEEKKEILDALKQEGYSDGSSKKSGVTSDTTVDEMVDDMNSDEPKGSKLSEESKKKSKAKSKHGKSNSNIEITKNSDKEISKFISSFIKRELIHKQDPIRHYNRGTRRSADGLLYNSMRRKADMTKKKLGILVDVSGSMDTDNIVKAASSLKDCQKFLDMDSRVVFWDTSYQGEYAINKIPSRVPNGGGTDMARGVDYLIKKKFTDIVVFSDFCTDMDDLIKVAQNKGVNMYSIIVDMSTISTIQHEYFNNICKKNIMLK